MGNITEENDDDDVASISKHLAYLHCWQGDLVEIKKKTVAVAVLLFYPPLCLAATKSNAISELLWFPRQKKRAIGSR